MLLVAVMPRVLRTKLFVVGEVLSRGLYQEQLEDDDDAWENLVEAYQLMDEEDFLAHVLEVWHVLMQSWCNANVGKVDGGQKQFPFDPGG